MPWISLLYELFRFNSFFVTYFLRPPGPPPKFKHLGYEIFKCSVIRLTQIKREQFGRTSIFSLLRRLMESCRKVRNQGEVKIYTCRFIDDIKKRQKENQMIESDLYQWSLATFLNEKTHSVITSSSGRLTMLEKLGRLILSWC